MNVLFVTTCALMLTECLKVSEIVLMISLELGLFLSFGFIFSGHSVQCTNICIYT